MGGMQVLQWAATYPERVFAALPIATAARHSSQNIAFHEVGRQAIMADPDWRRRALSRSRARGPARASRVARMAAHITYLSDERAAAQIRAQAAGPRRAAPSPSTPISRSKSYLRHQGAIFVERFDANSYLYMTRAMDYFDLAADYGGSLASAFKGSRTRFCVVSFTSDWLFPTARLARDRARAERRRRLGLLRRDRDRSRAMTPSCSTSPSSSTPRSGFIDAARARGIAEASIERLLEHPALRARVDLLRVAELVAPRVPRARRRLRRRGAAAPPGRRAQRRRARHRTLPARRQRLRRQGTVGDSGRRRHRSRRLSGRRFRLCHPVADVAGDAPAARRARTHAAHRPPRHRLLPEFRPLAHPRAGRLPRAACR